MKTTVKALIVGVATVLATTFATGASAATPWQREHAREAQVQRHIVQTRHVAKDRHINHLLRSGRITPRQAAHMHRNVHNHGLHRF